MSEEKPPRVGYVGIYFFAPFSIGDILGDYWVHKEKTFIYEAIANKHKEYDCQHSLILTEGLAAECFKRAQLFPSSPSLGPRSFATRSRKGLVQSKNAEK